MDPVSVDSLELIPTTTEDKLLIELQELKGTVHQQSIQIESLRTELDLAAEISNLCKLALQKCFTETQIDALMTGKSVHQWQENDIINDLAFRSLSLKSYSYTREESTPSHAFLHLIVGFQRLTLSREL